VINLHNHSTWSDGRYTPKQLARLGIQSKLSHLGISDHFFTNKMFLERTFVDVDQIDDYLDDLRRVARRFASKINLLAGIEVDWSARTQSKIAALWPKIDRFDYVLFEYVEDAEWHGNSLESLLTARTCISIPVGLAHNNLSENFCSYYTADELAWALHEHDIFVELSTNPFTAYYKSTDPYSLELWKALAKHKVRFSIGSDTHDFAADVARVQNAHTFLENKGLLKQLITEWWNPRQKTWIDQREKACLAR